MIYPTTRTSLLNRLDGDESAWTEFFTRYREVVADLGRFRGLSADECEELVQNVMIRFSRKIEAGFRYDPAQAKFRTFFSRLVKGCIYDLLRRREKPNAVLRDVPDVSGGDRPDELLDMAIKEKWRAILREEAMLELAARVDERTFQAFELYAVGKQSAEETAKLLDMSANGVYVAKTRCLKILRETISRLKAEDPELDLDV
jgi:RNA polymerase sigma factor (sigma-70 family)